MYRQCEMGVDHGLGLSEEILLFGSLLLRYDTLPYICMENLILHKMYNLRCLLTRKLAKIGSVVVFSAIYIYPYHF